MGILMDDVSWLFEAMCYEVESFFNVVCTMLVIFACYFCFHCHLDNNGCIGNLFSLFIAIILFLASESILRLLVLYYPTLILPYIDITALHEEGFPPGVTSHELIIVEIVTFRVRPSLMLRRPPVGSRWGWFQTLVNRWNIIKWNL